jgi:predicted transcriptional regulator
LRCADALLDENEQLKLRLKTFDDERKRLRIVEEEIERLKEENKWLDPEYAEEQLSKAFHEASKEKKKSAKKFCMVPEDTYKRQAAVVEAVIAYKDDLTVENWERVIEALAKSDGGGGETSP